MILNGKRRIKNQGVYRLNISHVLLWIANEWELCLNQLWPCRKVSHKPWVRLTAINTTLHIIVALSLNNTAKERLSLLVWKCNNLYHHSFPSHLSFVSSCRSVFYVVLWRVTSVGRRHGRFSFERYIIYFRLEVGKQEVAGRSTDFNLQFQQAWQQGSALGEIR